MPNPMHNLFPNNEIMIELVPNQVTFAVLEQLMHLPGYQTIVAGSDLNSQQFREFQRQVCRTIQLQREKRKARAELRKLSRVDRIATWVHRFAPFSRSIIDALHPFIKTCCFSFGWPYAEFWEVSDVPGARVITLVKSFPYACNRWSTVEPALKSLALHMKERGITLPTREVPGNAFTGTARKDLWDVACSDHCVDEKRIALFKEALIEKAYVLPLHEVVYGVVRQALVFYGTNPPDHSADTVGRFVAYASRYIQGNYGRVEEIKEDDEDEIVETRYGPQQAATGYSLVGGRDAEALRRRLTIVRNNVWDARSFH